MLRMLLFASALVLPAHILAQDVPHDVVELRDGGIVRAVIVEYLPRDHVTIQLVTGELRTFAAADVEYAGEAELEKDELDGLDEDGAAEEPGEGDLWLRVLSPDAAGFVLHVTGEGEASTCALPCTAYLAEGEHSLDVSRASRGSRTLLPSLTLASNSAFVFHYESHRGNRAGGVVVLSTVLSTAASLIVVVVLWRGLWGLIVVGGTFAFIGSLIGVGLIAMRPHGARADRQVLSMRPFSAVISGLVAAAIASACGARTGVLVAPAPDSRALDATSAIDAAGLDAGSDADAPRIDAGTSCGHDALARDAFVRCGSEPRVGQLRDAAGVTCTEVCCAFGFAGCVARAEQTSFDTCTPSAPDPTGTCADVYQPTWSSQCLCAP